MNQTLVYDSPTARATRGFHAVYREAEVNHCPGCGHTHWLVGRFSAECAFCATALPLEGTTMDSAHGVFTVAHKAKPVTHRDVWAA